MRVHICAVGRLRAGPERDLIEDYLTRFGRTGRGLGLTLGEVIEVEDRKGGEATDAEVAEHLGVTLPEYHKMLGEAASSRMFSLDDDATGVDWHDSVADESDTGPETLFQGHAFRQSVARAIEDLPERERMVMALYYDEELTLKEVGAVLELSESRVCQIHGQALVRLRARLGAWLDR